jgi:hypothetical protein
MLTVVQDAEEANGDEADVRGIQRVEVFIRLYRGRHFGVLS